MISTWATSQIEEKNTRLKVSPKERRTLELPITYLKLGLLVLLGFCYWKWGKNEKWPLVPKHLKSRCNAVLCRVFINISESKKHQFWLFEKIRIKELLALVIFKTQRTCRFPDRACKEVAVFWPGIWFFQFFETCDYIWDSCLWFFWEPWL